MSTIKDHYSPEGTQKAAARDRLVLALDVDSEREALGLVAELKDVVGIFKVGHQLFTAYGPDIVRRIIGLGGHVFLDLKYHDIPNTVAKASAEAVKLGVSIFNVHALGGFDMMKAASEAAKVTAIQRNASVPTILAVTVLTSMDGMSLRRELKITRSLPRQVVHLARLAQRAGMHGVVASPQEIKMLRREIRGDFVILTPGVRPDWSDRDDQKRIMTPGEAIRAGADYIVVGRPVLKARDRKEAVLKIIEEITLCQKGRREVERK
ncbi:MAG TPA: orotidine-5'-phosphate decarboxylase [Nitrospirota bacterium]|nr:orotidine-5'-phosphate decarboxylase [Nitrospirota bacterium]